jgi:hypothetical protein
MKLIMFFIPLVLTQSFIPKLCNYKTKLIQYDSFLQHQINNINDFTNFLNITQHLNNES